MQTFVGCHARVKRSLSFLHVKSLCINFGIYQGNVPLSTILNFGTFLFLWLRIGNAREMLKRCAGDAKEMLKFEIEFLQAP